MIDNLQKGNYCITLYGARFQVYEKGTAMNISAGTSSEAVIKFEEIQPNTYSVAVASNERGSISYGRKSKLFSLDDDITSLINVFPEGHFIDEVVAALLCIKEIN